MEENQKTSDKKENNQEEDKKENNQEEGDKKENNQEGDEAHCNENTCERTLETFIQTREWISHSVGYNTL